MGIWGLGLILNPYNGYIGLRVNMEPYSYRVYSNCGLRVVGFKFFMAGSRTVSSFIHQGAQAKSFMWNMAKRWKNLASTALWKFCEGQVNPLDRCGAWTHISALLFLAAWKSTVLLQTQLLVSCTSQRSNAGVLCSSRHCLALNGAPCPNPKPYQESGKRIQLM